MWRAEDRHEHHDFALKIISVGERTKCGKWPSAARLRSPHACPTRTSSPSATKAPPTSTRQVLFLAMDLGGQSPLNTLTGRPLLVALALTWAIQIGRALKSAHNRGIVHLDLKPSNILLGDEAVRLRHGPPGRPHHPHPDPDRRRHRHPRLRVHVIRAGPQRYRPEHTQQPVLARLPPRRAPRRQPPLQRHGMAGPQPATQPAPAPLSTLRPGARRGLEQLVLEFLGKAPDTRTCLTQRHPALAAITDAPAAVPNQHLPSAQAHPVLTVPGTAAQNCSDPTAGPHDPPRGACHRCRDRR